MYVVSFLRNALLCINCVTGPFLSFLYLFVFAFPFDPSFSLQCTMSRHEAQTVATPSRNVLYVLYTTIIGIWFFIVGNRASKTVANRQRDDPVYNSDETSYLEDLNSDDVWKRIMAQAMHNQKRLLEIERKLSTRKRSRTFWSSSNTRKLEQENAQLSSKLAELETSNAELKSRLEKSTDLAKAHLKQKHAMDELEQQYAELERKHEKLQDMYQDRVAQIEEQDMIIQRLSEQLSLFQRTSSRASLAS